MATLTELADLPNQSGWGDLVGKVTAACVKKAATIVGNGTAGAEAKTWAIQCISGPQQVANQAVYGVIGANASASVSQIFGAADADIESAVSDLIDSLYGV